MSKENSRKIDLVYIWCDSNDIAWLQKKEHYLNSCNKNLDKDSLSNCRFLNNDELKYSLRSVEKYLPWINNIFIVSDNQIPNWLNLDNPKIHLIKHEEILSAASLPTFNASAIETAIHKIPNLSEHFLFANDDMFVNKYVDKSFFFQEDGTPIFHFSGRNILKNKKYKHLYGYMISRAFKIVAKDFIITCNKFPHHNIDSYRKSDIRKCVDFYNQEFEKTALQRFRQKECVQRSIYGYYSIANGNGKPKIVGKSNSLLIELTTKNLSKIEKYNPYLFCINDSQKTTDEDRINMQIYLSQKYPLTSSYEKNTNTNSQILVCYHKQNTYLENDIIKPIQVGADISDYDLPIIKDNTFKNISSKNKNFCELTALYWLWKNSSADYVGLMHYRRLFDLTCNKKRWYKNFTKNILKTLALDKNHIEIYLKYYDVILPMQRVNSQCKTNYIYYQKRHIISDLDKTLEIIKQKSPEVYPIAEKVIKRDNKLYLYNMFISKEEFLNEYATWLFSILDELEKEIAFDVESRDDFQQRVYGFLSERLFSIFVEYKKLQGLRIKEVPVVYCESKINRYNLFQIRTKIYKFLTKIGIRRPHWKEQYGV